MYMKVKGRFDHFNINVTDLKRSIEFYDKALGLKESHDYDEARAYHKEMGCVCFENEAMGLYFINDPDDYWIEILPEK